MILTTRLNLQKTVKARGREWLVGYTLLLPAFVAVMIFSLIPIGYVAHLSLHDWNLIAPQPTYVGLRNFERLLASMVIPLCLALLLDTKLRGMAFFRALFFLPHLTPIAAIATLWFFLYDPYQGLINTTLEQIGIPGPSWLQGTEWSLPALVIMKIWKSAGYYTVLYLAGLQNIPTDLYDAAQVDGANGFQRIRHVTLPLLTPMILFVLIIAVISSFQDFDLVAVMTGGDPAYSTNILIYYLYEQAFERYRFGMGSAIAVIMLVLLFGFTAVHLWLSRRWVNY